ncbi:hypothetical protein EDB83DRAFT_2671667 [Lactarius deliciosus]|nr:hypothetical protein EDB83DRAFT_2671667 [Lactarius deliciosus]
MTIQCTRASTLKTTTSSQAKFSTQIPIIQQFSHFASRMPSQSRNNISPVTNCTSPFSDVSVTTPAAAQAQGPTGEIPRSSSNSCSTTVVLNVQIKFRTKGRQRRLWLVKVEKPLPPTLFSYRTFRGDSPIPEARASPIHNNHNRLSVTYRPSLPAVAPATAHPYPLLQYFYRQTITRKYILQRWEQHTNPGTLRHHPIFLQPIPNDGRVLGLQRSVDAWLSANKQPPSDSTTSTFQHDAPSHAPSYGFRMIPELAIPTGAYVTEEVDSDVDIDDECTTELYDMYKVSNEEGPQATKDASVSCEAALSTPHISYVVGTPTSAGRIPQYRISAKDQALTKQFLGWVFKDQVTPAHTFTASPHSRGSSSASSLPRRNGLVRQGR